MCLYIDLHSNNGKEQIAKKDIVVYKILIEGNYAPYHLTFIYKPNTLYRLRKKLKVYIANHQFEVIHAGFHAYTDEYFARKQIFGQRFLTKMIIPKGARFYIGLNNEIVASSIRTENLEPIFKSKLDYGDWLVSKFGKWS